MGMKRRCCQLPSFILLCALLFLLTFRLGFCYESSKVVAGCIKAEKKALLKFKGGLTDPSGRLSSWVGEDCCVWRGVICDNRTGNVVKLKLQNPFPMSFYTDGMDYELGGVISLSLLDLKYLRYLDLSKNNFEGSRIPNFFGSLIKLRYLNLSDACFGGAIPRSLGNLSGLLYLDISNNFANLEAKDWNWISSLSSLRYLNLGRANLSKASSHLLQSVNFLPSLVELHLPRCRLYNLSPSLPSINLTSLSVVELSHNFINSIPHWLLNISSLLQLGLSYNHLQGRLPDKFEELISLQNLDLSRNILWGGQLPPSLGKLCNLHTLKLSMNNFSGEVTELINTLSTCNNSRLETLDLGYNTLTGRLPNSLGYIKKLRELRLPENMFSGSIPDSIGNLSSLEYLYLSVNEMSGRIPGNLGQLSSMIVLDLSENSWQGVITETHFANLSSLKELQITKHLPNISEIFKIDPRWLPPFKLRYINIRNCELGTKFSTWLESQNELRTVVLQNVRISGSLHDLLLKLDLPLDKLDVSHNNLSGQVHNSFRFNYGSTVDLRSNCFEGLLPLWSSNVSELYLGSNLFSGPIPPEIGEEMPLLTYLDISSNHLNGSIPLSLGNLKYLYYLDISNNNFSGKIPSFIGSLSSLGYLFLGRNRFSGEVPSSLQNCTRMGILDIGDNRLSGNLPSWTGEAMPTLLIFRARNNSFTGDIPWQFCGHSYLHILDLSNNKLTGIIPTCLGDLIVFKYDLYHWFSKIHNISLLLVTKGRIMEYKARTLDLVKILDLSSNNLSGGIPQELTTLGMLGTLNLSRNLLTGKIPEMIGDLEDLETLDLSHNKFVGEIPASMASLTFLSHLDLSFNNLSGEIPTNNQFHTFNDPSIYEGNLALCGIPLATKCSGSGETPSSGGKGDEDAEGRLEKLWFYLTVALGFFMGFWGVCGSLTIKRRWRLAFFRFLKKITNEITGLVCLMAN
ncbi:receptor-like protein EIX2 [Diospyros lotus]|uniref:receptor-like protein EIX2 n=1 Tax=Diospyros lotus TaxID=55363 RepID=UPI00225531F4|nr:receptor-like protein EIX2 [Diospyros lotus]